MKKRDDIDFGSFNREILSEQIAARILSLVKDQKLQPGDRLPPERDLATQMGVSRPSLREALRALSIMNIVEHRQGSGTFISSLKPELLIEHLDFVFALDDSTYLDLLEARKVFESGLAEIAAQCISDEEVQRLELCQERSIRSIDDDEAFLIADLELHDLICKATRNPILSKIMASIVRLGIHSRRRTVKITEIRNQVIEDHEKIINALKARDPQAARQAMFDHLDHVEKGLKDAAQDR